MTPTPPAGFVAGLTSGRPILYANDHVVADRGWLGRVRVRPRRPSVRRRWWLALALTCVRLSHALRAALARVLEPVE